MERQLIEDYRVLVEEVTGKLTPENHALAVDIASVPEYIRGYGHVKERHLKEAKAREADLVAAFRSGQTSLPQPMAAE